MVVTYRKQFTRAQKIEQHNKTVMANTSGYWIAMHSKYCGFKGCKVAEYYRYPRNGRWVA
jgi:hypothetical protein